MKRSATCFLLAITALSFWMNGCKNCPPEADDTYTYELTDSAKATIPYAVSDSFQMADTAGNQATFAVMTRDRLLEPKAPCECCPSETNEHLEVRINRNATASAVRIILIQDGTEDVPTETRWTCWVDSSAFTMRAIGDSLVAMSPSTASVHNSMQVGSHTFLNVYEIHNGATDSTHANVIWYSTHGGLLKYKKVNGQVWSLL